MAYQHCQKLYLIMGGNIMNKKICSISILLIFLIVFPLVLVACDKTPAKYDIKNFYGTYDQFANDYFTVYFSLNGKQGTTDLTIGWWDICELKENSFVYIDTTGEKKEKECDAVLIAKIRELQQRIGHKVAIEKKKITFVDSNAVLNVKKYITKFDGHEYFTAALDDNDLNMFIGRYKNCDAIDECKIVTFIVNEVVDIQGDKWGVAVTKNFIK